MSGFTGTRQALLFALKRDRVIIPVWLVGLIGWMAMYVVSYSGLYGTQAELDALYKSVAGNPAVEAMSGPTGGLRSLGGAIAWDSTPALSIICAVYAMFSVIRHSRAEEEDARTDLLLASGAGRLAPLAAALIVTSIVLALAAIGFSLVLVIGGLAAAPSILLALGITGFALVIASTTAVFAQVSSFNGSQTVTSRIDDVSANGFSVRMQEQENSNGRHNTETIDWMAIDYGTGGSLDGSISVSMKVAAPRA